MKITFRFRFFLTWLLLAGWQLAVSAQEPPATPAAPASPAQPAAPAREAASAPPAPEATTPEPALRRLDEPAAPPAPASPPISPVRRSDNDIPFGNHVVGAGVTEREVVSVFGSSIIDGEVSRDVVSVFGNTRIGQGARVGGAVVAVLGRLEVDGPVGGEAVSVLGGSRINSHVRGQAVAVLGNLELGPNAVVDGEVVVVGGRLIRHPNAVLRGSEVNVPGLAGLGEMEWLTTWFNQCLLWGRPLAFGENLGWAWVVAFSFLGLYLLLALIFPRGIEKCATTLETRPGYSILASILTVLLTPVVIVLLAVTLVGVVLIPFLGAGLLFAKLFGKAVMLAWIGRRISRLFGNGPFAHPVVAVLIGGLVVVLLYTIPVFGFMLYKLLSWLAVGVVIYTIALALRREPPVAAAPMSPGGPGPAGPVAGPVAPVTFVPAAATPTNPPVAPAPAVAASPSVAQPNVISGVAPGAASVASFAAGSDSFRPIMTPPPPAPPPPPVMPPPVTSPSPAALPPLSSANAAVLPRAGLMVRLGALLVDVVLVAVVLSFSSGLLPRVLSFDAGPSTVLPIIAIYGAVMWKTKGTTIGGIIFGLKVVRLDGLDLDWPTAVVRALSCFLSLIVAGLGFLWVAIDEERQSWHDKIAGTAVVRVPKGMSLL